SEDVLEVMPGMAGERAAHDVPEHQNAHRYHPIRTSISRRTRLLSKYSCAISRAAFACGFGSASTRRSASTALSSSEKAHSPRAAREKARQSRSLRYGWGPRSEITTRAAREPACPRLYVRSLCDGKLTSRRNDECLIRSSVARAHRGIEDAPTRIAGGL